MSLLLRRLGASRIPSPYLGQLCSLQEYSRRSLSEARYETSAGYGHSCPRSSFASPPKTSNPWTRLFSSASTQRAEPYDDGGDDSIKLSEDAVVRLRQLQEETPEEPVYLRLMVEGGGCSGFQYEFTLDSHVKPGDRVYEQDGAKLVSDDLSLEFLRGSIVDFESDLMRSGFVVADNPNAASSCGCGSSFVAK